MLHTQRRISFLIIFILLLSSVAPLIAAAQQSSDHIAPLVAPIPVYTAADLNNVRNNPNAQYIQMADIDLGMAPWNEGAGWEPLGNDVNPFTGVYDGNGFTITNLTIHRPTGWNIGLFGLTDPAGTESLKNIHLTNVSVTGSYIVGGLVGMASGPVINCSVSGNITADNGYSGGIVGLAQNTISHCAADVSVQGKMYAGGIAGYSDANIFYSTAAGSIHGTDYVGGICGYSVGDVWHCHSDADITGQRYLGGLLGVFSGDDTIVNYCSATGSVASTLGSGTQSAAGGLIGWTNGIIKNSHAAGSVTGIDEVGGLVGYAWGAEIYQCHASGNISGTSYIGGLTGATSGLVQSSWATGPVTGYTMVGGLVGKGETGSRIIMCQASGHVTGYAYLGGLVGDANGLITCSSASGHVTGTEIDGKINFDQIGGLVGVIRSDCTVSACYALGNTAGNLSIGGLVGSVMGGNIRDSYAQGTVTGNDYLGGLVGFAHFGSEGGNDISRCYATGLIQPAASTIYSGGLIGRLYPNVALVSSYYDSIASGQTDIGKGDPRTTLEMLQGVPSDEIYTQWDDGKWCFAPDTEYPWLHSNRPVRIPVLRLAGSNRYTTATVISQMGWPECKDGAKTVILATGANFPDSLAGVTLAYALDAPILLTTKDALPLSTKNEIERLDASQVIILGGTGAVSTDVYVSVQAIPGVLSVQRIAGSNRYETAREIALQPDLDYNTIFLASGLDFPDALSAAAYAARRGQPILLNGKTTLSASVKAVLQAKPQVQKVIIVGGTGAIADSVIAELHALGKGLTVQRIAGGNRYETSLALANNLWDENGKNIFLATGTNFPDALAGGVLAANYNGGVLLVRNTAQTVPAAIGTFIHGNAIAGGLILGGVSAVTLTLEFDLYQMLKE